jgi:hypothetical protein
MPPSKECPLCGESMRLKETETVVRVPGNPNPMTRTVKEWICLECDHFEEPGEDDT